MKTVLVWLALAVVVILWLLAMYDHEADRDDDRSR